VFQVGLRWQTGTDWDPYFYHFAEINQLSDIALTITGFEPGYSFFVLAAKFLSHNYTVFLLIHSVLYYFLIFSAFKKLSPYIFISLLLLYATTLGILGSNRQLIALGICLYALKYIADKESVKFFVLIVIAFFFHTSALIFIVYYFLNRDLNKYLIYSILILAFIIGKTGLPFWVFSFIGNHIGGMGASKVLSYIGNDDLVTKELSIFGLFKRLLFLWLFLYNYEFLTAKLATYKLMFNGYVVGLVLYLIFSSSLLIIVNRGSLYFNIMENLLLACQFLVLKNKYYKLGLLGLVFIMAVFLMFQSIGGYEDLFVPYKGIFINSTFQRERLE
jgi:hypothetical protein